MAKKYEDIDEKIKEDYQFRGVLKVAYDNRDSSTLSHLMRYSNSDTDLIFLKKLLNHFGRQDISRNSFAGFFNAFAIGNQSYMPFWLRE